MRTIRAFLRHPLAGPALRYAIAGATVAGVYLAIPLVLNGVFGVAIQITIPIAYVLAVTLHFNLQRHFVFRHVAEFALSVRQQIGRYVGIGAIQYPTTALATAFLPGWLGISERVTFVLTTVAISITFFLVLRGHVFHETPTDVAIASAAEHEAAEQDILGQRPSGRGQVQPDPVEAQVHRQREADGGAAEGHADLSLPR
jgi:putative flippase GtrA